MEYCSTIPPHQQVSAEGATATPPSVMVPVGVLKRPDVSSSGESRPHSDPKSVRIIFMYSHCSKSSFFVQKFNFDFLRKLSIFGGEKTREDVVVLDFLAVDNFDFTRKIVKNNLGENS